MDNLDNFNFYIGLQKGADADLIGVASATSLDRDEERMSDRALKMMVSDIKSLGVNLFGNHEHNWENTLGVVKDAELVNDHVNVKIDLDDPSTNPKIPALLNKLNKKIKLGLSVGGKVTAERTEFNKELNKKIKIIDGVKLYEISVVGIPSNADAFLSIPQALTKSAKSLYNNKCLCCYGEIEKGVCKQCLWKKV
jgi:HK97 family phage prohead protease